MRCHWLFLYSTNINRKTSKMNSQLSSMLWITTLLVAAGLAGGYVADHLQTLERDALHTWQEKLTKAGNAQASKVATYLQSQQKILQEINQNTTLRIFLQTSQTTQVPITPNITRTLDGIANLKYSLKNTYIFDTDNQLLVRQPEARTIPFKVRENLSRAYLTGLKKAMFFATFENKTWFIVSRRIQTQDESLGYSAFMLEAPAAMDPLGESVSKWQDIDFNLARRSGDENVFVVNWGEKGPTTKKHNLEETNIPIFSGTADTFQAVELIDDEEVLMYVSRVPTFPFWQHMSSIPTRKALADVRTEQMLYLFGLGVVLLFIFALMLRFIRRFFDPSLPVIPQTLTGRRPNTEKETAEAQKAGGGASSKNLLGHTTGAMPSTRRPLSDGDNADIQKSAPSVTQTQSDTATISQPETFNTTEPTVFQAEKLAKAQHLSAEDLAEQHRREEEKAQKTEQEKVIQIYNCLQNQKYRLYFQPIIGANTKEKAMFETLLRLVDEKGDLMQPGEFFPLAIKHGFVEMVDDMVIAASLPRHMEILTHGKKNMLNVNLSHGAFDSLNFMDTFKESLNSGRLNPELLNFELNPRDVIQNKSAMTFVRDMQKSGANFSVDFFGEPEKTVKAAKKLNFDYMKLDCLEFDGLGEGNSKQVERFKNVVDASKEHNLPVIAEKIETDAVLRLCEKLGVPYVQGFYLAEPSPKLSLKW